MYVRVPLHNTYLCNQTVAFNCIQGTLLRSSLFSRQGILANAGHILNMDHPHICGCTSSVGAYDTKKCGYLYEQEPSVIFSHVGGNFSQFHGLDFDYSVVLGFFIVISSLSI